MDSNHVAEQGLYIPPGRFDASALGGASPYPHSMYPTHEGVAVLMDLSREKFAVTAWGLAGLLGVEDRGHIYKWLNGARRPAAVFLSRLLYLVFTFDPDMEYKSISAIDWGTGMIQWRDGRATQGSRQIIRAFDVRRKADSPAGRTRTKAQETQHLESTRVANKPVPKREARVPGRA